MLEYLTTNLLWWHWVIFGLILITTEIFLGTFLMLGLGVAAMVVGAIDLLFFFTFNTKLFLWIILSILSIVIWFKYLKDVNIDHAGQSNYALDTKGVIVDSIEAYGRGKVKFDRPILGNTLWQATSKEEISIGSRVKIVEIKGQLIVVEAL